MIRDKTSSSLEHTERDTNRERQTDETERQTDR